MEIRFLAENIAETETITSFLATRRQASGRDKSGSERAIGFQWSDPSWGSGLWQSVAEWICNIDISAIPIDIAIGLLTNYLWDLIQRGKGDRPLQKDSGVAVTESVTPSPPFENLSGAKVTLVAQARQIDFDPLNVDYATLEILVGSLFDDKDAAQSQNH